MHGKAEAASQSLHEVNEHLTTPATGAFLTQPGCAKWIFASAS